MLNIGSLLSGVTSIKTPECMFFCKMQYGNEYIWGFLSPSDERLDNALIKKEVSIEKHQELLSGGNIVYYNGEVFNAKDENEYYLDENSDYQKRASEEYNQIIAAAKKAELVQTLYSMKAAKAYGGVIINDLFVFETNQTAITNTVATLSLMSDSGTSSWKFYTKDGEPYMQTVTKAQLFGIASFGRQMIDSSFATEGQFLQQLEEATVENLVSEEWVNIFTENAQNAFDAINNNMEVNLA